MKTWLITGASGGIGAAVAHEALARGDRVILSARNPERAQKVAAAKPSQALAVRIDVTDGQSIASGLDEALAWSPRIDVLVNNAGHGLHGAVEEVSDAEARRLFDVNFFGQLDVIRAVLPQMRRQRGGLIFNMGSVSGIASDAGTGLYSATKFALAGATEALRAECAPLGIHVTVVEPGPFRTEFNGRSMHIAANEIADYVDTAGRRTAALRAGNGKQPGDPAKAAAMICDVAELETPPAHLVLGAAAIERARTKIERLLAEIAAWEDRSRATAF